MKKSIFIGGALVLVMLTSFVAYALTWPTTFTRHTDIMMAVTPYEPSGLAWNPLTDKIFTVCNTGQVTMMNPDGTSQETRKAPVYADYEAITIVDPTSSKVYIGIENPDSILEYDWNIGFNSSMRSWNLTSVMTGADNSGLEGLTFVPNGFHPFDDSVSGGLFYAAIQRVPVLNDSDTNNDYLIYAFDIDLSTSGKIVKWWGIPVAPGTPTSDISDMYFNKETELLYVLYDGANRLIEMKTDGTVVQDFSGVPINNQEGIVVKTSYPSNVADVYLASDSDRSIGWYSGYPVSYPEVEVVDNDKDDDGVTADLDCNDDDASISANKTYYQDLDKDGLGSDVSVNVCSTAAPSGYVTNSDDVKDNDFDNDGVVTSKDCNDSNPLYYYKQFFFIDFDGDGYGSWKKIKYTCVPPAGYVTNAKDKNDKNASVH